MAELAERISRALVVEEARAERFANSVRLVLLIVLTVVALLNALSVSREATLLNGGAIFIGYVYGLMVFIRIRRSGYHPLMKYVTSCLDIVLVFALLFMYTKIEIPSVALKNYVFFIVFPLIGLTAFRYDRKLTIVAGGLAIALYILLIWYVIFLNGVNVVSGGYERELFSGDITYVGQVTKILILAGYVLLLSYLAQHSRNLFAKLVSVELSVRNEKEMTDWELKIASHVQSQFLPRALPVIGGLDMYGTVQQGRFVGGDYCDFIELSDDVLLMVSADVSGKGVPAALIMAEVRAATHVLASMNAGLEDLARRLNTLLHQSTDKKSFVTFFAAEVDGRKREVRYVIAGHPPPLICVDGKARLVAKGTIPLGVCASLPQLTKHVEEFPPGGVLVAYTDGLTEQTDGQGDQYGEERLMEFLRANARLDARSFTAALLDEIREFGEGDNLNDDVSVAIVKNTAKSVS